MSKRKHSKETKRKIAESLRKHHRQNKDALLFSVEKQKPEKPKTYLDSAVVQDETRDRITRDYIALTAHTVRSVLDSTETGKLDDWLEFAEAMKQQDSHIRGLMDIRKKEISGKNMRVEPAIETPEAKKAAAFIELCFREISRFETSIRQLLDGIFNGVAVVENMFENKTANLNGEVINFVGIRQMRQVDARKFRIDLVDEFNEDGEKVDSEFKYVLWDYGKYSNQDVLSKYPGKFVIHSPGEEYLLSKRGELRSVAYDFFFKKLGKAYWVGGSERFAYPAIIGKVPHGTPQNVKQRFADNLKSLQGDGVMVTDIGSEIETVDIKSTGGDAIWKTLVSFLNDEITKVLVGSKLNVEAPSQGSFALGNIHNKVFRAKVMADCQALADTLKEQVIRPLLQFNLHLFGGTMPPTPEIWFDISDEQFTQISDMHVKAGVIRKNDLRRELGLPLFTKEEGGEQVATIEGMSTDSPQIDSGDSETPEATPAEESQETGAQGEESADSKEVEQEKAAKKDISQAALNGAQVTALQGILISVSNGELPKASAIAVIVSAFPISQDAARAMVDPIEIREPTENGE